MEVIVRKALHRYALDSLTAEQTRAMFYLEQENQMF